jgi:predicted DNA-binding protein (MmcQ/YjbR family)
MPSITESAKRLALALEGVGESIACAGTSLEQCSFAVGKKAFLFVHERDGRVTLRMKLGVENAIAIERARAEPEIYQVGKQGWVTVRLPSTARVPAVVRTWIQESHALASGAKGKARARSVDDDGKV